MTYFDKLLEFTRGDAKEAAIAALEQCPGDFFKGGETVYGSRCSGAKAVDCCNCWFSEVEE